MSKKITFETAGLTTFTDKLASFDFDRTTVSGDHDHDDHGCLTMDDHGCLTARFKMHHGCILYIILIIDENFL